MENKEIKEVTQDTEEKLIRLLQLAQRAGKLKYGIGMLKTLNRKIKIIVISKDVSESNLRKINNFEGINPTIVKVGTKVTLGQALGREAVSVISLTDVNFGDGIMKLVTQN